MELVQNHKSRASFHQRYLSMPTSPQSMFGKSTKFSSGMDVSTQSSKCSQRDRYAEEPEILDWSEKLNDKHTKIVDMCNKYNKAQTKEHFDFLAANYEGMYLKMGYPDPKMVAKYVNQQIQKNQQNPSEVQVLDLACGTGLVGKYLQEYGVDRIFGLDISPNMLEEASKKGVYEQLNEYSLGTSPNDMPQKFKNQFDYVTCAGLINNNHMDYLIFEEMLLSCKKGGYVVFAARYSFMGKYWYDSVIKEMTENGRWKMISVDTFFKYDQLDQISIGRFSKTPCKVYVFQKTQDDLNMYINKDDINSQKFLLNKFKEQFKKNLASNLFKNNAANILFK